MQPSVPPPTHGSASDDRPERSDPVSASRLARRDNTAFLPIVREGAPQRLVVPEKPVAPLPADGRGIEVQPAEAESAADADRLATITTAAVGTAAGADEVAGLAESPARGGAQRSDPIPSSNMVAWLIGASTMIALVFGAVPLRMRRLALPGRSAVALVRRKFAPPLLETRPTELPRPQHTALLALAPPDDVTIANDTAKAAGILRPIPWSTPCHASVMTFDSRLRWTNLELLAFLTNSLDRLIPYVMAREEDMSAADIANLKALQAEIAAQRAVIAAQIEEIEAEGTRLTNTGSAA